MVSGLPHRERIWRGTLEWNDKQNQQSTIRQVQCEIYASISKETNEVEVRGENWPTRLIMQLMPRAVITNVGGQMLRDAKIVNFQWGQPSESFESLSKVMANGFAGCVHFNASTQCDVKILILLYMPDKKSYYGFIPNDQNGYVDRLRRVIQQSKMTQFGQNPGMQQQQNQQVGPRPQMMNPISQQNVMNPQVASGQNMGNLQGQGDQSMMFNQQMQMQGAPNMVANQPMNPIQQRPNMTRPNMMPNNLRHLLQQVWLCVR
jgi:mediator of RNA polymerase II transcription subunit 25